MQGEPKLLQVVLATGTPRRFTRLLHSRQQERNKHPNDGDDN
jgi:hypothetical protein